MASLIDHKRTGLHFEPGDPAALIEQVAWALDYPAELNGMRAAARAEFDVKYTAEANYPQLMGVYEKALGVGGRSSSRLEARVPEASSGD